MQNVCQIMCTNQHGQNDHNSTLSDTSKDKTYVNDTVPLRQTLNYGTDVCSLNQFCLYKQ